MEETRKRWYLDGCMISVADFVFALCSCSRVFFILKLVYSLKVIHKL